MKKKKKKKNGENIFRFWDNCIWSTCYKLSLLRSEYLLLGVNGLKTVLRFCVSLRVSFFNLDFMHWDQWIWQRCCRPALNSVSRGLPCYLSKDPLKRDFLDIYLTTFFGIPNFKKTSTMGVMFVWKIFKIESKFRKCKKISGNIFHFRYNCIWKCCHKLPLLRKGHLLSGLNWLINSPKILYITQRDFFNLNCEHRDQ